MPGRHPVVPVPPRAGFFLTVTLWRSKNRQTAVRLPGIRCLRIAATISSRVRSGCSPTRANSHRVLLQRRGAPSARLCSGASSVTPALQPFHRRTGAQVEAFGCLPPRRPGFDGFDHTLPQVIRIRPRHWFGPPETPNQCLQTRLPKDIWESPRFDPAGTCSNRDLLSKFLVLIAEV